MSSRVPTSNCYHKLINNEYCKKCGSIFYRNEFLIKHIKYNYPCELSPLKLCHEMISSNESSPLNNAFNSNSKNIKSNIFRK